jgi:catechol 2,3-dioxygenase-like lactoylglutathione lyase family enzyme
VFYAERAVMEERPSVAIGHVSLRVSEVESATRFYETLGLRVISSRPELAILELRGGTHLLLFRAKGKPREGRVHSFDFMVDDVQATRQALAARGLPTGPISADRMSGHERFEVTDPDGHVLVVMSTHVGDRPV